MDSSPQSTGSRKRQARGGENMSKRQARREELRRKERQQRYMIIGGLAVVALAIIGLLVVPAIRKATNTDVPPLVQVTPVSYNNTNGFSMGNPDAKVKVEVFEDYKCSACKTYSENVEPEVIKNLVDSGQVYYVFYQFPFLDDRSSDKPSDRSANAAMCAADQNKFWNYKQMLFANQNLNFSDATLIAMAEDLGLDVDAFRTCYNEKQFQSTIDEHLKLGEQFGVSGTPSVYVNGKEVSPGKVPSFAEIQALVQAAASGSN